MKISTITLMSTLLLSLVQVNAYAEASAESEKAKQVVVDYFSALNESNVKKIVSLYHKNSHYCPGKYEVFRLTLHLKK